MLEPMGGTGADPVWSMGDDTPIPPLSAVPQSLYAYFRQRFAQVTNPPIDSLREAMVMSLRMHLGRRGSPLLERPSYARMLRLEHPVLLPEEMAALRNVAGFSTVTLDARVGPDAKGTDGLRPALTALRRAAERAARRGAHILIISDRAADRPHAPIPMLLAIGAVRQHLVHTGLRARVGLVAEAGDAFDIHHFATLIGYGAEAVHPGSRSETLDGLFGEDAGAVAARAGGRDGAASDARRGAGTVPRGRGEGAAQDPVEDGHLHAELVLRRADLRGARPGPRGDRAPASPGPRPRSAASGSRRSPRTCWSATARRIRRSDAAGSSLPDHGRVRFRKEGEDHGWAPPIVVALQQAVEGATAPTPTADSWPRTAAAGPPARATCWPCAMACRFRSRRSSPRSRSGPASSPRRCRSARCRRRRTPRSPSR